MQWKVILFKVQYFRTLMIDFQIYFIWIFKALNNT